MSSGFNGGKSQVNFNLFPPTGGGGEYQWLNYVKNCAQWTYNSGANSGGQVSPQYNDVNGYPQQCPSSTNGYGSLTVIPPTTVRGGTYTITWTGGDAGTVMNYFGTIVSGSRTGANGTLVVQPSASATPQSVSFGVATISSSPPTNYVTSIAIVYTADLTLYNAGEVFGTQFKAKLLQGGFGVYRFLDWALPNQANMATWELRKPVNYFTYGDDEWRANIFAGTTTNSGNDYSISFGSGGPTDKQTLQLYFNANATYVSQTVTFGSTTVNWASNSFVGGEPIAFSGGSMPSGLCFGITYYVLPTGLTSSSFSISLTPGGSAVACGTGSSGTIVGVRLPTLNLNSTGAVPFKLPDGGAPGSTNIPSVNSPGGQAALATMVYDADLNSWLTNGGNTASGSQGLSNGAPYEIMLQLCKEMGAHPWFSAPFMAVDPMSDFHTQLATYIKANMPSWMIPRFETCNELWNDSNNQTQYAFIKAFLHWNTQFSSGQFDYNDWQGKTASTIGQAVNAVYGGAVGAGYQVVNGQWTSQFTNNTTSFEQFVPRLASTNYISQSQAAQSGYTKSAASNWCTHVANQNYFNPSERDTSQETTDAATFAGEAAQFTGTISGGVLTVASVGSNFGGVGTIAIGQTLTDQYGFIPAGVTITGGSGTSWTVSNSSINIASGTIILSMSSAATALATSYLDTCGGAASSNGNLAGLKNWVTNCLEWAATYTNSAGNTLKGNFYEGGYSPDLSSSSQVNFLRYVSKFSNDGGSLITGGTLMNSDVVAGNYPDCITAGVTAGTVAEFPSLYQFGGTNNIWSVMDPDVYVSPTSAQWNAIATYH